MNTTANVNYHVRSDLPQAFQFDVDGVAGTLISPELKPTQVSVRDLRGATVRPGFSADGIEFVEHRSAVTDFKETPAWRERYDAELTALLVEQTGAEEVVVFDHTVRIDDPDAERRPARNVHNDYSQTGAEQRLEDLVGAEVACDYRAGHYGFVNVWRPIDRPIESSPLGFLHPASVAAEDWVPIELIYPDRIGHILGVVANAQHDWFYLSGMTPDEVAIFNIYDNRGRPQVGHSALDLPGDAQVTRPRQSIESRTLVRYR
ncbi:MAG: CmcJ/NvfI family oxidoreductase [Pseudomonadota bacterium]